jgi:hypothetical protein
MRSNRKKLRITVKLGPADPHRWIGKSEAAS